MLRYDYPDVLGAVTGGIRFELETLQCALGVHPTGSALGQPFEALIALQSKIDQPQRVMMAVLTPRRDAAGRRLSFFMPRKLLHVELGPGEVGVMQVPIVAQDPTLPARGYPLKLRIVAEPPESFKAVRSPGAGRPPSVLSMSPFRLDVLRGVRFCADVTDGDHLGCRFDIIPGQVKVGLSAAAPKYDTLWTAQDFPPDQAQIESVIARAEAVADDLAPMLLFHALETATQEHFAGAGLPLHPGESLFITKTLAYIFTLAPERERDFVLYDARWFEWLCSLLAGDGEVEAWHKGKLAAGPLYFGALFDAVRIALPMVQAATGEFYGSPDEHRLYADKVVLALQGSGVMDLGYAYLPLIMAGVLLNPRLLRRNEDPLASLELLDEARRGRVRLAVAGQNPVFDTLDAMIREARQRLLRGSG